jgi:protocatechuate 3,4-dioxygenase beta subunit
MSQRPKEVRNTSAKNANNREAKQITCTGKVVDARGQPIADAKVKLYRLTFPPESLLYDAKLAQELATKDDGAFTIKTKIESDELPTLKIILAEKEELALGWAIWRFRENLDIDITLGQPKVLSGTVVDENQKPIAEAEVGIAYMTMHTTHGQPRFMLGDLPLKLLKARTDTEGKFSFDRIPEHTTVDFLIKKPGRATVSTINPKICSEFLQFSPGQADIKLIQPVEAKIEGMVVEKASGKPVAGTQIMVTENRIRHFGLKPVISRKDGTFSFDALAPGKHILQTVTPIEGPADWVAEPVEVITEAGKTKSGVKVELCKGGLLEVVVTEAESKKPLEKASVRIWDEPTDRRYMGRSDKDGIALIRLVPGEYRLMVFNKQGLTSMRRKEIITIEDDKTAHIEWQFRRQPTITGIVRNEQDKPIKGAKLIVCPMGLRDVTPDAEGKFEVIYDPDFWFGDKMPVMFLLGRYEKGNLAAAVEIEEDTKTIDIKLKPGLIFTGKVVDPDGKGIANARITIILQVPKWQSSIGRDIARTDAQGSFEVKAIPPEHKYKVSASADGYGGNRSEVIDSNDAVNNHLDVGTITLAVANLSISGMVVDTDDKPVADAKVSCYGENQPHHRMKTEADGKFTFEKICAGKIQISAGKIQINAGTRGKTRLSGRIETNGGATNVKVVMSERPSTRF